jgi:hypothetical protein
LEGEEMNGKCEHQTFVGKIDVVRISDSMPMQFRAEISIQCAECKADFQFFGLPIGFHSDNPTTSLGGKYLRAPIKEIPLIGSLESILDNEELTPIEILPNGEIRAKGAVGNTEIVQKPLTMREYLGGEYAN